MRFGDTARSRGVEMRTKEEQKEYNRAYSRAHYQRNKEKKKAQHKHWHDANKEKHKELQSKWEKENREHRNLRHRPYYEKEKAERLAKRPETLAKVKIKQAARKLANAPAVLERKRARTREWHRKNPAKARALGQLKRARKRKALIGDMLEIEKFYEYVHHEARLRCYYCKVIIPQKERHVDHKIPLARGGAHSLENLCCACAVCNMKKHTKTVDEFTKQLSLFTDGMKYDERT